MAYTFVYEEPAGGLKTYKFSKIWSRMDKMLGLVVTTSISLNRRLVVISRKSTLFILFILCMFKISYALLSPLPFFWLPFCLRSVNTFRLI